MDVYSYFINNNVLKKIYKKKHIELTCFIFGIIGSILIVLGEMKGYWLLLISCFILVFYFLTLRKFHNFIKQILLLVIPVIGIYQYSYITLDFESWFRFNKLNKEP